MQDAFSFEIESFDRVYVHQIEVSCYNIFVMGGDNIHTARQAINSVDQDIGSRGVTSGNLFRFFQKGYDENYVPRVKVDYLH